MNDLILKTRLEALHNNIQRVRDLVAALRERKQQIDAMQRTLKESSLLATELLDDIANLDKALRRTNFAKDIRAVEGKARDMDDTLQAMQAIVDDLQQTVFFQITRLPNKIGEDLQGNATKRFAWYNRELAEIGGVLEARPPDRHRAWSTYNEKVRVEAQRHFTEYVEFIGGLAVRDVGLDEGISQLADELMQNFSFTRLKELSFLSVPAREHATKMTLTRVIRLGFPEWTIWALPFTAHEFWYEVANELLNTSLDPELDGRDQCVQECLADAFATYAMGPAYAYAAILLRLDPFCAYTENGELAAHDIRAHAIVSMLRQMDEHHGGEEQPYRGLWQELDDEWRSALKYVNPQGAPNEELKQVFDRALGVLFDLLERETASKFPVANFHTCSAWADKLRQGKGPEIEIPRSSVPELRWVLNAAWLARRDVTRNSGTSGIDRVRATQEIADQARELWRRVQDLVQTHPPAAAPRSGPRLPLHATRR